MAEEQTRTEQFDAFVDRILRSEPPYVRVLLAIGHTVVATASFENVLFAMIARHQAEREANIGVEYSDFLLDVKKKTAGARLTQLKRYGIADSLAERIADLIDRRNDLIHRPLDDPYLLAALTRDDGDQFATDVATRVLKLARDCDDLEAELRSETITGLETALGRPMSEIIAKVLTVDPSKVTNERHRAELERTQEWHQINPRSLPDPSD